MSVVYVNGVIAPGDRASVPVFDHGFLYGEGIYETLRTYSRVPFLFDRHIARLRRSAAFMALAVPFSDTDLLARVHETMAAHDATEYLEEAYIRILLTRGVGDLSYSLAATPTPTLVIIVKPYTPPPDRTFTHGIKVSLVETRRNHPDALNPAMKSNNLLNNALAMQEAHRAGAEEALMQNHAGELAECSQSNFFLVRDGAVLTPPLSAGLLPGITRDLVIELCAELGVPVREAVLRPEDLAAADEAFLTGTTREVTPVVAVDDLLVGAGTPGPISTSLLLAFRARTVAGV